MEGNFGVAGAVSIYLLMVLLRGRYGRITSTKTHLEELFTCLALLGFSVAFSLVVARSHEAQQRYQNDVDLHIPARQISPPATPEEIGRRLSNPGRPAQDICSACHSEKDRRYFQEVAARVSADYESNISAFSSVTKQLRAQAAAQTMVIRSLPAVPPPKSGWRAWLPWLDRQGRESRRMATMAKQADSKKQSLEKRLLALEVHYGFQGYRTEVGTLMAGYVEAIGTGDVALAAHRLLTAADSNARFYSALAASSPVKDKARLTLLMLQWGAWVLVSVSLVARYLVRRLIPEAPWYVFPGLATCWGMSTCLMTDYSLNYLLRYRFLGLYTWAYILVCHLLLVLVIWTLKSPRIKLALARLLGALRLYWRPFFMVLFFLVACFCKLFQKQPQVSSEAVKLYLVAFFAWYATFRGSYISSRIQVNGFLKSLSDLEWMRNNLLVFVLFTGLGGLALVYLKDFGPLLLILTLLAIYSWLIMGWGTLALTFFAAGVFGTAGYLLRDVLGRMSMFAHIYERFSEMLDPFHLGSGELAKLSWLRKSAGTAGYPFGQIPYFGHFVAGDQQVTPAQLQSDYSSTHIIAQLGYPLGMAFLLLYLLWILKIFIDSSQLATMERVTDTTRFIGWFVALASLLLLIQGTLTIAGGFTVAPLTGITLPLISFGCTSSLMSAIVFALFYAKGEFK